MEQANLLKNENQIKALIKKIVKSAVAMRQDIHKALCSCLDHGFIHGDMTVLDRAVIALNETGTIDIVQVGKWISGNTNLNWNKDENSYRKPKGKALEVNLVKAMAVPFWEYGAPVALADKLVDVQARIPAFIKSMRAVIAEGRVKPAEGETKEYAIAQATLAFDKLATFVTRNLKMKVDAPAVVAPVAAVPA